jgi:hypothetical protein
MHVNDWKRIAEREASRYRENKAFIQGVADSGGAASDRYRQKQKWVLAVEYVLAYLHRTDAEKERFFRLCYGIDGTRKQLSEKGMVALSFSFNVSVTTLYRWRTEYTSLLMIAAAQTGALRPYGIEPTP